MKKVKQNTESGRTYGGESAADRLARQRRQFMDAGLELFGTIGYRATTVRMLCKQAGLIDRYFYKTFRDTEDLLVEVYTEAVDQIKDKVISAISEAADLENPELQIRAGLDAFFTAYENARVARVCWLEVLGVSPRIDALYTSRIQDFGDLLLLQGKTIKPSWSLPEEETRITGIALVGAIIQSAMQWLLDDYRSPRATLVNANSRLIRSLLESGQ